MVDPNAVEVWQEALRIPPVKVYDKGKLRKDVWDLIFANIRFDIVQHDMKAEIGALPPARAFSPREVVVLEFAGDRQLVSRPQPGTRELKLDSGVRRS